MSLEEVPALPLDGGFLSDKLKQMTDGQHERKLQAIAALRVMSRDPNLALDELAAAAASIFEVPHALITAGMSSQWYQGQYGLPHGYAISPDTPGEFVVGSPHDAEIRPLVVPDLMAEPRIGSTELAASLGARFYAGVPLITGEGRAVGTLCLMDRVPRRFTHKDVEILRGLSVRAVGELELRIERAKAERDLQNVEERSREKAEMVAWTAHELKNPLTVIKGISTMLATDPKFPLEMRTEFMLTIGRQVDRMLRMIDETLDLARLEAGMNINLSLSDFDLVERLLNVTDFYEQASPRHTITLETDQESCPINGDKDKVDQVLFNLVGNAVKYSPEGGPVLIKSTLGADEVEITVKDPGLGMSEEQLSRLFGRFSRLHTDSNPRIRGTGLGLFLTKHLVDCHGGRIWAESTPGEGSTFHVAFPRGDVGKEEPSADV